MFKDEIACGNQIKSQQNKFKCWSLVRGENRRTWGKTSRNRVENQQTQSNGGRRVLSPPRQPCSPTCFFQGSSYLTLVIPITRSPYTVELIDFLYFVLPLIWTIGIQWKNCMTHYILRTWWNLEFEQYDDTVEYTENRT